MQLDAITPLILTYNEAPNVQRTLHALSWAKEIVVVDSGSTDGTLAILRGEPRVRVIHHPFTGHADQWNFALRETGIATEWVLGLDADYVLSRPFVEELRALVPEDDTSGYRASFRWRSLGHLLRGAMYPPVTVLYRRERAAYWQEGHAQRVTVRGLVGTLRTPIVHDDRKPLDRWLWAQGKYATLEAQLLGATPWSELRWPDRLRCLYVIMPLLVPVYCLFCRGGVLAGKAGLYYAFQRMIAEAVIAMRLMENRSTDVEETGATRPRSGK